MLTLEEIKERLASRFDESLLLELLNVNSFDLVDRFSDLIESRVDYFETQVADTEDESETDTPEE